MRRAILNIFVYICNLLQVPVPPTEEEVLPRGFGYRSSLEHLLLKYATVEMRERLFWVKRTKWRCTREGCEFSVDESTVSEHVTLECALRNGTLSMCVARALGAHDSAVFKCTHSKSTSIKSKFRRFVLIENTSADCDGLELPACGTVDLSGHVYKIKSVIRTRYGVIYIKDWDPVQNDNQNMYQIYYLILEECE